MFRKSRNSSEQQEELGGGSARLDGAVGVGTQRMLNSAQHTPTEIWEWQLTEYGHFSN